MTAPFIRDNREQYPDLGIPLPGLQDVRDQGRYHSPLVETITVTANTEEAITLRTGVGKIKINMIEKKSFSVGWAAAGPKSPTPPAGEYCRENISKDSGLTTVYLSTTFNASIIIETWLIGS